MNSPLARRSCATANVFLLLAFAACAVWPVPARGIESQEMVGPADTSSPRATLKSFITACNELHRGIESQHYFDRGSADFRPVAMRILDCIDASNLPEFVRPELSGEVAVCLKEILDRIELPPEEEIPDAEAIEEAGGPEKLSRWQIPGTRMFIARMEDGPRRDEYLFTTGTVDRARDYFRDIESLPYRTTGPEVSPGLYEWYMSAPGHPTVGMIVDQLPDRMREEVFGQSAWKWSGLVIVLLVAVCAMALLYRLHSWLANRYRAEGRVILYCLTIVLPVAAALVPIGVKHAAQRYLTLRGTPLVAVSFCADVVCLLAIMVVIGGLSNRVTKLIIASPKINPKGLDAQVVRILSKLFTAVACVIVFLEGGRYLGFPITTLLAATGVGGLAVALAAQDMLKTVFGTIMLMVDRPFRVGERIIFEKYDGVVEDIGLRSTKLRLLTGHQATIPNDELARVDIENVGRRPYIRRVADIHIPLDTQREKLEKAVVVVREALKDHEGMDPEFPPRAFFFDFNPSAFVIRVIYWYNPPNYWDYLAFSEKVNFEVFRAFDEQGIQFSLPARITHTSLDAKAKPIEVTLTDKRDTPEP